MIRRGCENNGFFCFLARCQKEISGGVDESWDYGYGYRSYGRQSSNGYHEITEVVDEEVILEEVTDFDGNVVAQDLPVDEVNFLEEDPFGGQDPDDEEYSGHTGNEGCNATQWYSNTVLVMVPTSQVASFLLKQFRTRGSSWAYTSLAKRPTRSIESSQLFRYFQALHAADPSSNELIKVIRDLGRDMAAKKTGSIPADILGEIATSAIDFDDPALLGDTISSNPGRFPADVLFNLGRHLDQQPMEKYEKMLDVYISRLASIHECYSAAQLLHCVLPSQLSAPDEEIRTQKVELLSAALTRMARTHKPVCPMDGQALVWLMQADQELTVNVELITSTALDNAAQAGSSASSIGFLAEFFQQPLTLPNDSKESTFVAVLDRFLSNFNLRDETLEAAVSPKLTKAYYDYLFSHQQKKPEPPPESKMLKDVPPQFAALACKLLRRFPSKLETLLTKTNEAVDQYPLIYFKHLWLPILRATFLRLRASYNARDRTNLLTPLFAATMNSYMTRYVGLRPHCTETDWARRPTSCSCRDCLTLNIFLTDPGQRVGRFPVGKQRRHHLHVQIERAQGSYKHETERVGNPQTLVVTKTRAAYDASLKDWNKRHAEAIAVFGSYDQKILRELLADLHEEIVPSKTRVSSTAKRQKTGSTSSQGPIPLGVLEGNAVSNPAPANEGAVHAGTKRKAEELVVIDLTGDDN